MLVAKETAVCIDAPYILADSLRPAFSVAMLARRRYLNATPPRVEGMRRPFDPRILSQPRLCTNIEGIPHKCQALVLASACRELSAATQP